MKKLAAIIVALAILFMVGGTSYADCQGCCSSHGGVCCIDGVTKCCDGKPLSQKCIAKGCNKCGSTGSSRSYSTNHREYKTPKYQSVPYSSDYLSSGHSSGYSGTYSNDSHAKPVVEPFPVYFKTGRKLVCDYAWRYGKKILLVMHGKEFVIRYDESEIDVKKSFQSRVLPQAPSSLITSINRMK